MPRGRTRRNPGAPATPLARGITSDDRVALDLFHPITRYGEIKPIEAAPYLK